MTGRGETESHKNQSHKNQTHKSEDGSLNKFETVVTVFITIPSNLTTRQTIDNNESRKLQTACLHPGKKCRLEKIYLDQTLRPAFQPDRGWNV